MKKQKTRNRLVSVLLSLCMALALAPAMSLPAFADTAITTVAVTGVTAPAAGAAPSTAAATVPAGAHYTAGAAFWMVYVNNTGTPQLATDNFANGNRYVVTVTLTAETGYVFGAATATLNGSPAMATVTPANKLEVGFDFGVLGAAPSGPVTISSIVVSGVTAPAVGATPVQTCSVAAGQHVSLSGTYENGWYDDAEYPRITLYTAAFAAEGAYDFAVTLLPDDGYAISQSGTTASLAGIAAGSYTVHIDGTNEDDGSTTIWFEFPALAAAENTYTGSVSPTGGDFGTVAAGGAAPAARTYTLTNTGTGTLQNCKAALSGTNADVFDLSAASNINSNTGTSLAPAGTDTFRIGVSNVPAAGTYTASVRVTADHMADIVIPLTLTVTASPRAASVTGDKNWGFIKTGMTAGARTFTLTNTGTEALSGLTVVHDASTSSDSGAFTIGSLGAASLAPGVSTTFTAQPSAGLAYGAYDEIFAVKAGADTVALVSLQVTLSGAAALYATPDKAIHTRVGLATAAAPDTFTLKNDAGTALNGVALSLAGADAGSYTLDTSGTAGTLAAGGSTPFAVALKANLPAGTYTADVMAAADSVSALKVATLTWTVAAAHGFTVSPGSFDFGITGVGYKDQSARIIKITNNSYGDNVLTGLSANIMGKDAGSFAVYSGLGETSLEKGKTTEFAVHPKTGLPIGTYEAEVVVTAQDVAEPVTCKLTFTVMATPNIVSGADQSYQKGGAGASFITDAPFSLYTMTFLDGKLVPEDAVTAEPVPDGGTKVTVHDDFLAALQNGVHRLEIDSKNGAVKTTIALKTASGTAAADAETVSAVTATKAAVLKTGDSANLALWAALLALGAAGTFGTAVYTRKKKAGQ